MPSLIALLIAGLIAPTAQPDRLEAAERALAWIATSQTDAGWIPSLGSPEPRQSWLWDQALALLALGHTHPEAAGLLVDAVVEAQNADGSFPACVDPDTGLAMVAEPHVGSTGLMAFALSRYGSWLADEAAAEAARAAADWLAERQGADGSVSSSTLANIGAWWGLVSTGFGAEARKLSLYLTGKPYERSDYWFLPEPGNRTLVCDVNTMASLLLSANRQYAMAAAALIQVRSYLFIRGVNGQPGIGISGPVGVWYEGTAQYVAAEGLDAGMFVRTLLDAQNADGSVPHSDRRVSQGLSWHTRAPSLSATVWLAFALEGHPFSLTGEERRALTRQGRSLGRQVGQGHPSTEQAEGEYDP